jgi:hypothetical protein
MVPLLITIANVLFIKSLCPALFHWCVVHPVDEHTVSVGCVQKEVISLVFKVTEFKIAEQYTRVKHTVKLCTKSYSTHLERR